METQHIPAFIAKDAKGDTYARIAPTLFPGKADGDAPLVHRITAYNKAALWDSVQAWFDGGKPVSGEIESKADSVHTFNGEGARPGKSIFLTQVGTKRCLWRGVRSPPLSHSMKPPTVTNGPKTR